MVKRSYVSWYCSGNTRSKMVSVRCHLLCSLFLTVMRHSCRIFWELASPFSWQSKRPYISLLDIIKDQPLPVLVNPFSPFFWICDPLKNAFAKDWYNRFEGLSTSPDYDRCFTCSRSCQRHCKASRWIATLLCIIACLWHRLPISVLGYNSTSVFF